MTREQRLQVFGQELRKRRKSLGLSQLQLADRLGISNKHLSQLETVYSAPGRPPSGPGDDLVQNLARVLHWPVPDIRGLLDGSPVTLADAALSDLLGPLSALTLPPGQTTDLILPPNLADVQVPERAEDWPPELRMAMHYASQMSPEAQRYVYRLWLVQAVAHAKVAEERNRVVAEIENQRRELADLAEQRQTEEQNNRRR